MASLTTGVAYLMKPPTLKRFWRLAKLFPSPETMFPAVKEPLADMLWSTLMSLLTVVVVGPAEL